MGNMAKGLTKSLKKEIEYTVFASTTRNLVFLVEQEAKF